MADTAITLHDYWRSSSSYRVRIGLNLAGLDYVRSQVDLLAGDQVCEANLARNPQGLVPTLQIDGTTLTQSLAILEYLDEAHGAGFLPPDAKGRARVRALAYAVAMEIQPVCNLRVARFAVEHAAGGLSTEDWMRHFIRLGMDAVERLLEQPGTGIYAHGDRITLADICLVPQVYNARRWGVELSSHPLIGRISTRLEADPRIAAAHPDRVRPAG